MSRDAGADRPGAIAAGYRNSIVASTFQALPIPVELHIIGRATT
jgi:hypothetical protein